MTDGRGGGGFRPGAPGALPRGRPASALLALAVAVTAAGCAHLFGGGTDPSGLGEWDHRLRTLLAEGDHDRALELVAPERAEAGDDLLRLQHEGLVAHYAGDWERSSDALETAFRMIEDRYTKSVTKAVLSMLASDRVLDYYPPEPERLLLHYYGALNYLRRGEPGEAAVEARRLGRLLERGLDGDGSTTPPGLGWSLSRFAGAVFETAGAWNDAAVAYRRARAFREAGAAPVATAAGAAGAQPGPPPAEATGGPPGAGDSVAPPDGEAPDDLAPEGEASDGETGRGDEAGLRPVRGAAPGPDSLGEVLVVVERGFVAHKVERDVTVFLLPGEIERLRTFRRRADDGDRPDTAAVLALAERVIARAGAGAAAGDLRSGGSARPRAAPRWPGDVPWRGRVRSLGDDGDDVPEDVADAVSDDEGEERGDGADDGGARGPVLVRLAWPVYRETTPVRGASSLVVDDDTASLEPDARTDLSDAVRAAYAGRRALDVAKTLLRAATKAALAEGVEEAVSEEDETLGGVAGWTARIAGALLERADTRCWHLLPARLELYRLRLPPGAHRLEALVPRRGTQRRALSLGTVEVEPGGVRVVSARAWE